MADLTDEAKGLIDSDKGEKATDAAIDKGQDAASNATGGKSDGAAEKAGDVADQKLGQ
ncbi:antitoxin [Clavibacter capsici]|uniref:antitoxin n=1 Tax=Clavibacter capsici TaxID=1874630 RepID=UPI00142869F1|nr:antitoxin [Clavibacter capsici]QIS42997.1 antitoxin [Clavibacter capsici]